MSLLVASIDFGTTYSGWAFSFKHEFESDPVKISAKQWTGGQLVSQKGPTCLLIKPDGKTLEKFGYEAESTYADLAEENLHKQWFYFRRFKMLLFGRIGVERNIKIEDATGKKMSAKTVFSLAIRFLKDDLIKVSQDRLLDGGITDRDVHWVITVPAIWNDAAKQFMREAGEEAGIPNDKLTIALEPEAASIYCRHLPVDKSKDATSMSLAKLEPNTKYLVVDAGGGTVDITVHEVTRSGDLRELHKASGGAWGGTKVDDAYESFLDEITGASAMKKFRENHMEDYIDLFRNFEVKKRELKPGQAGRVVFRTPVSFIELAEEITGKSMNDNIQRSKYSDKVSFQRDKLKVEASVAVSLFDEPVNSVVDHLSSLLKEPPVSTCKIIVMVGGFSESPVLQHAIKERFSNFKVFVPADAGLTVLKGAVVYGHNPRSITERVCKYTYGEAYSHTCNKTCKHEVGRRKVDKEGNERCYDMFNIHIRAGQTVRLGEAQKESIMHPKYGDETEMNYTFHATSSLNPTLITENGCHKVGNLTIPITDTSLGKGRQFVTRFFFGGTEIEVQIEDKSTGEIHKTKIDFLG